MKVAKSLDMIFKNEEGKTVRVSIPDPQEPVNPAQVVAAMDVMIEKNIFELALTEKVSARLTESTQSEIDLF